MTQKELSQIAMLNKEIVLLKNNLLEYNYKDGNIVTDKVRGSMSQFPYSSRSFTIEGMEQLDKQTIQKREQIAHRIAAKTHKLLDMTNKAYDYIDSIQDSTTRQILTYTFINNISQEQIAEHMGISVRTVQRKFREWKEGIKNKDI